MRITSASAIRRHRAGPCVGAGRPLYGHGWGSRAPRRRPGPPPCARARGRRRPDRGAAARCCGWQSVRRLRLPPPNPPRTKRGAAPGRAPPRPALLAGRSRACCRRRARRAAPLLGHRLRARLGNGTLHPAARRRRRPRAELGRAAGRRTCNVRYAGVAAVAAPSGLDSGRWQLCQGAARRARTPPAALFVSSRTRTTNLPGAAHAALARLASPARGPPGRPAARSIPALALAGRRCRRPPSRPAKTRKQTGPAAGRRGRPVGWLDPCEPLLLPLCLLDCLATLLPARTPEYDAWEGPRAGARAPAADGIRGLECAAAGGAPPAAAGLPAAAASRLSPLVNVCGGVYGDGRGFPVRSV